MYNDKYINGLTLDVIFEFDGIEWLVVDKNKVAYMLTHFHNKKTHNFKVIHFTYNRGMLGFWYCRKFYSTKQLNSIAVKVNKKLKIFDSLEEKNRPSWL